MKEKGKLTQTYEDVHLPLFLGEDKDLPDLDCVHDYITCDIDSAFYHICILLNNTRKKYL